MSKGIILAAISILWCLVSLSQDDKNKPMKNDFANKNNMSHIRYTTKMTKG